ncbi:GlxA family transcriptional regulator [Thetidibacter halocola]|nr:helix-turn-helix domain-containing protein [Thetidibacter halocola]
MLVYPQVASVDVSGPLEVFGLANFLTGQRLYQPITASVDGVPVPVAGGFLKLEPTCSCADLPDRIDTLLVAGGPGCFAASEDAALLAWLQRLEPRCARMGSVCTGSTVLLSSGVVEGRKIATHWLEAMRLQSEPGLATEVDRDAIFVQSGKFWTSAGMMAGVDLALALIERDQGRALALDIARFMVLVLRRDGGQSQFSSQLLAEATEDPQIRKVQSRIWEDPGGDLSLESLATVAGMSKRSLGRRFAAVTGTTLSQYIEDVRLNIARRLLEVSTQRMEMIAFKAGFGTTTSMRRAFARRLGVSPNQYRKNFGSAEQGPGRTPRIEDGLRMDLENLVNGKSAW